MVESLPQEEEDERRLGTNMEPVFYHTLPTAFWAEVLRSCSTVAMLDLSASDKALPWHASGLASHTRGWS